LKRFSSIIEDMKIFLLKKVRRNKMRQAMSDMLKIIRRKEIW